MLTKRILRASVVALTSALTLPAALPALAEAPIRLPKLNIDVTQTTVSGVSSGAYMATQMHIAYSDIVTGAGLVAGGPYGCATGVQPSYAGPLRTAIDIKTAMERCMKTTAGLPDLGQIVANIQMHEKQNTIGSLDNMRTARVYIFSGGKDSVVAPEVVAKAEQVYLALKVPQENIAFDSNPGAEHAFLTSNYGSACDVKGSPYLNNCGYDQAGALLRHLYPELKTPNAAEAAAKPVTFSQKEFIRDPSRTGMLDYGYVYIPESCANGQSCRIHVAFHGCEMSAKKIGDTFAANAGYNRWADVNNLVVLYPQIDPDAKMVNALYGCWDWIAYTGYDYNLRSGFQPSAVRRMIAALSK